MIQIEGLWWPDDVGEKWRHAFKHVKALEASIALCAQHRTAVQAGGNIGLWPRRMADVFTQVFTFEPEPLSYECLIRNVPERVMCTGIALGAEYGRCGIERRSLGSHQVVLDNDSVTVAPLDWLALHDLDLLQLDIEGYEWHALFGAEETIRRCRPIIHLELRDFTAQYGSSDAEVRALLDGWGYREVTQLPGNDVVFQHREAA